MSPTPRIATLVLLTALLVGLPQAPAGAYEDPAGRYAVDLPAGWAVAADPLTPVIKVATAPAGDATVTVANVRFGPGQTLDAYVDRLIKGSQAIWEVRERGPAKLAGQPAVRLIVDQDLGQASGKPGTRELKLFTVVGDRLYTLSCAAFPATWAAHLPAFEAVAASFKPRADAAGRWEDPRAVVAYPPTWQATDFYLLRPLGGADGGRLQLSTRHDSRTSVADAVAAAKAREQPGTFVGEDAAKVGDRPARRLRWTDADGVWADWAEYLVADGTGHTAITVKSTVAEKQLPRDVQGEVAGILLAWRWK